MDAAVLLRERLLPPPAEHQRRLYPPVTGEELGRAAGVAGPEAVARLLADLEPLLEAAWGVRRSRTGRYAVRIAPRKADERGEWLQVAQDRRVRLAPAALLRGGREDPLALGVGSRRGVRPNLLWTALTMAELRRGGSRAGWFLPLTDARNSMHADWDVVTWAEAAYASVPQDSAAWADLHGGVLTTSRMAALLGMYHPHVAKRLGKGSPTDRGRQRGAYEHLRRTEAPRVPDDFASWVASPGDDVGRRYGGGGGASFVRMLWGSDQEAASIASVRGWLLERGGVFEEIGLCMVDADALGVRGLPPLGASPDCMLRHVDGTRSVIEIKSQSPFIDGKKKGHFGVVVRRPYDSFKEAMLPQVQLEMLATRTTSAYLISVAATGGATVFRVDFDEAYCRTMLELVRDFCERCVAAGVPPDMDRGVPWRSDHGPLLALVRRGHALSVAATASRVELAADELWRADVRRAWFARA